MVTDGGSTQAGGHKGIAGLTVFFFFILLMLTLFTETMISNGIKDEFAMMESYLPTETMAKISQRTTDWYQGIIVESGFQAGAYKLFIPNREEKRAGERMSDLGKREFVWFEGKLDNFFNLIYQFMLRISHILSWYPLLIITIVPAFIDGVMSREVKKTNFDYTSPILSFYSAKLSGLLFIGVWVALWLPLAYPPIFVPIFCLLLCYLIRVFVANLQKRL